MHPSAVVVSWLKEPGGFLPSGFPRTGLRSWRPPHTHATPRNRLWLPNSNSSVRKKPKRLTPSPPALFPATRRRERTKPAWFTSSIAPLPLLASTIKRPTARACRSCKPGSQRCSPRSEEHTSELQSRLHLVCRLLLEKKKKKIY